MEFVYHSCTLEQVRPETFKENPEDVAYKMISTPVGLMTLTAYQDLLIGLTWGKVKNSKTLKQKSKKIFNETEMQLKEYFLGKRIRFEIPVCLVGTEFQKKVWNELRKIPYGQTISYGEQAQRIGNPRASRAVGSANGKNPIGIIIPCHRVIGSNGSLTGFAAGIEAKQKLLALEKSNQRFL